ncbi:hypothetical protein [Prochlorococcus marinus]|uniref:hypothetical protein n=1 Tax=Prochlorococcus TaxID=1218 RepID=UPI0012DA33C3|nr:hypothetical protein [Prochlorococcus marinus]
MGAYSFRNTYSSNARSMRYMKPISVSPISVAIAIALRFISAATEPRTEAE